MVVLNKIYTKTGDAGETALGDGSRVAKHSARVEAYGTVDEANAALGVARLQAQSGAKRGDATMATLDQRIERIQNDMFDLGADLCTPETERDLGYEPLRMTAGQAARLETEIDEMNAKLEPLRSFILPGGAPLAAQLHVCRTVTRRAERRVVALATMEAVNEHAVVYLNRLSDWLFVAGRIANDEGRADILWTPGANR